MSDPTAPIVDFINRFNAALGVDSAVEVEHTPCLLYTSDAADE